MAFEKWIKENLVSDIFNQTGCDDEEEAERVRAELRMRCSLWFSEAERLARGEENDSSTMR